MLDISLVTSSVIEAVNLLRILLPFVQELQQSYLNANKQETAIFAIFPLDESADATKSCLYHKQECIPPP